MPNTKKSTNCKKRYMRTKSRKQCKQHTQRKQRKQRTQKRRHTRRFRGGRSDEPTVTTVDGFPVTEDAVVSIPGKGIYDIKAFKQHEIDMDFQGEEQEQ